MIGYVHYIDCGDGFVAVYTFQTYQPTHLEACSLLYVNGTSIKLLLKDKKQNLHRFSTAHQIKPDFSAWYSNSLRVCLHLPFLALSISTLQNQGSGQTEPLAKLPNSYCSLSLSLSYSFSSGSLTYSRPNSNAASSTKPIQITQTQSDLCLLKILFT